MKTKFNELKDASSPVEALHVAAIVQEVNQLGTFVRNMILIILEGIPYLGCRVPPIQEPNSGEAE